MAQTSIVRRDQGKSFWNRHYLERFHKMATRLKCFDDLNKQIYRHVEPNPDGTILEMGCGSGRNIPHIIKALDLQKGVGKIYAVDYTRSALEVTRKHLGNAKNVVFKRDNLRNLSFEADRMDAVFDIFAGCYIPSKGWETAIKEAFRVMKPGGIGYFLYFIHRKRFVSCFRSQVPVELFLHPVGVFWAFHLKFIDGLNVWDKHIERGDVVYPGWHEFSGLVKTHGGIIEVAEKAFLTTCIFVKARKNRSG